MNGHPTKSARCALCGQTFPPDELVPAEVVRPRLAGLIRHEHPACQDTDCICLGELNRFRMEYVRQHEHERPCVPIPQPPECEGAVVGCP